MEDENRKKSIMLTIISVAVLSVAIIGATYAYFAASIGSGASTNINVTSKTTDSLSYNSGNVLSLEATQQNFYEGAGSLSASTTALTTLTANNTANAKFCYTVDLVVSKNDFIYTVNSNTPELTFTLKKNETNIISLRDITTLVGTVHIPTTIGGSTYVHEISAGAGLTVTDTFIPTVEFVNLGTNQKLNEGKTLSAVLSFNTVACP